jgi:hypothetical protein
MLISKTKRPAVFSLKEPLTAKENLLRKVGEVAGDGITLPTAADLTRSGSRLVVSRSAEAFVYTTSERLTGGALVHELISELPQLRKPYLQPATPAHVEGTTFVQGDNLLFLSETREIRYFPRRFYESASTAASARERGKSCCSHGRAE